MVEQQENVLRLISDKLDDLESGLTVSYAEESAVDTSDADNLVSKAADGNLPVGGGNLDA